MKNNIILKILERLSKYILIYIKHTLIILGILHSWIIYRFFSYGMNKVIAETTYSTNELIEKFYKLYEYNFFLATFFSVITVLLSKFISSYRKNNTTIVLYEDTSGGVSKLKRRK